MDVYLVVCIFSNPVVHTNNYSECAFHMQKSTFLESAVEKGGQFRGDLEEAEILLFVTQGHSGYQNIHWSKSLSVIQRVDSNDRWCALREEESWVHGYPAAAIGSPLVS